MRQVDSPYFANFNGGLVSELCDFCDEKSSDLQPTIRPIICWVPTVPNPILAVPGRKGAVWFVCAPESEQARTSGWKEDVASAYESVSAGIDIMVVRFSNCCELMITADCRHNIVLWKFDKVVVSHSCAVRQLATQLPMLQAIIWYEEPSGAVYVVAASTNAWHFLPVKKDATSYSDWDEASSGGGHEDMCTSTTANNTVVSGSSSSGGGSGAQDGSGIAFGQPNVRTAALPPPYSVPGAVPGAGAPPPASAVTAHLPAEPVLDSGGVSTASGLLGDVPSVPAAVPAAVQPAQQVSTPGVAFSGGGNEVFCDAFSRVASVVFYCVFFCIEECREGGLITVIYFILKGSLNISLSVLASN